MLYVFIVAILGGFTYLALKNLKLALAILVGLLPLYLIRFNIGPVPTTLLELLIITTILIWLYEFNPLCLPIKKKRCRRKEIFQYKKWLWPLGFLILTATIGVIIAPDTLDALGIWKAYFVEPVFLFFVFITTLQTRNDWQRTLKALAISTIVLSIIAIAQYATDFGIPAPWDIERRVTSIFEYPNALGLFLAPIVGCCAILYARTRQRLFIAATLLGSLAIILAETEAAYVAIPAGLLITFLLSDAPKKNKRRIFLASIIILLVAFIGSNSIRSKLLLQDYSGQVRQSQWSETIELLENKPIFGAGLNGYTSALEPYHDPALYEIFQYPHNILFNTWVELGLLGVVAMIWLILLIIKAFRTKQDWTPALAAFSGLAIMTVHGLVDVPFFKNDLAILTVLFLALIAQIKNRATKR